MPHARLATAVLGALAAALLPAAAPATATPGFTTAMEVFSPDGSIHRVPVTRPVSDIARAPQSALAPGDVTPIEVNGPSASRFDLVFVGDGYTSDQLGTYAQNVRTSVAALFAVEPYKSYRGQFNIWQVDVASAESGVDNDPALGVNRKTALDSYFWCGGIERLLCVNETKANQYAAAAPDVDQVIVLANTTKYGGAGGSVATSSGGNAQASQIVIHELGHSIGGLADEYDYGTCDPAQPEEPNATTYTADQMRTRRAKWYDWLGQPSPDGGTVGAYAGARYCTSGMYRPSQNSVMRTLGQEFNPPSTEAMIAGFYREADTIDSATTAGDGSLRVAVAKVPGPKTITWSVDDRRIPSGGTALDVRAPHLAPGAHTVAVTVTDDSDRVRDKTLRAALSDTRVWHVDA
ncbi:M64 family metallopeptidase [Amycolatopsis sp. H20-H5]|uniref:M64 family metallopeptidase n=1 Tax=Amycolatopsis sp. H20-H5 TaxID=3046309 RepID=UPI002DBDDA85|nr:M64 family metallopeptidase [Amycolatopsis sp. H20-H5]MEC3979678.1 M64 family metallopeptidase [Amycolatopsis sp. H20-H5]